MPTLTLADRERLAAIQAAYEALPPDERAALDALVAQVCRIKGVGPQAGLEIVAAIGICFVVRA